MRLGDKSKRDTHTTAKKKPTVTREDEGKASGGPNTDRKYGETRQREHERK